MEGLIKYFAEEGRVIFQAPATFLIALVLLSGLIWAALSWQYSGQIGNLQSRLTLRDDQIADYKTKLDGATPDEAKRRLDALELQVKALSPRRLTENQKKIIVNSLKGTVGTIEIAQDMAVADARAYTGDFALAFQAAGWQVTLPAILGPGVVPPSGVALQVANPAALKPIEVTIKRALEAAKVDFDIQAGMRAPRPNFPGQPPAPDVGILLTARLR